MQRLADQHAATKGREFILTIQDTFREHYDENDEGKLTARHSAGDVYARESSIAHRQQPSTSERLGAWMELTLGREITDPKAVPLRAGFGNQRIVITKAHAVLVGNWDRSPTQGQDGEPELSKVRRLARIEPSMR